MMRPRIECRLSCVFCGEKWDRTFIGGNESVSVTCPNCNQTVTVENVETEGSVE